jgi:hypothetical protein
MLNYESVDAYVLKLKKENIINEYFRLIIHIRVVFQQSSDNSEEKSAKVADNENSTHIPSETDEQQKAGSQTLEEKTTTLSKKMNDQDTRAKDLGKENKETPEKYNIISE